MELTRLDDLASQVREISLAAPASADGSLRILGYQVGREIHRGGQGIVYAARQLSTGREVAIKVLLHGALASPKQQLRFEREIDLAARIQHPNVVSILDRGQTEDGRGFLTMELVDGPTLDGYIAQESIRTEERLRLFLQICSGVRAAHQRGVLHRDLQPGNILIEPSGSPKVLDFGLAKDDLGESVTMARTVAGEFMGTLAYASPEQLRGDPDAIDSRTDVYSLGVLLYELITEQLPHDMTGSIDAVIRRVREHPPKRPSSIMSRIDPDLEIVILHALEQDKERRYASVDALASDVEAVLEHRPIEARRASTAYQIRKFARRHRVGVAIACVVLLGVAGTITGLGIGIVRANTANRIAEQRRIDAETELVKQLLVSTFFNELLAQVDPGQSGSDMRVTELLNVASARVGDRFGDYPGMRGSLQHTLGETYTRLGSYEPAETQVLAAIDAFESQAPVPNAQLAASLGVLGQIQIATTRLDDADSTLALAEQHAEALDDSVSSQELRAQLAHQRGALLYEQGEFEASIEAYAYSLGMLEDSEADSAKRIASQALIGLGVSLKRMERFEEA
ncbi:MAG: protein kinase, partial [Phycisphaerales bacterium]